MRHLWSHIEQIGRAHGVDPAVFAILYLAHHPLFWGTMAWLAFRAKRRRPIALQIGLGVFFWFMPYLYILVFGRGLPGWIYAAVAIAVVVGGTHVVQVIRSRLNGLATGNPPRPETIRRSD